MNMEEIKIQSLIETLHLCAPTCPQGRWSGDSAVESLEGHISHAVEERCVVQPRWPREWKVGRPLYRCRGLPGTLLIYLNLRIPSCWRCVWQTQSASMKPGWCNAWYLFSDPSPVLCPLKGNSWESNLGMWFLLNTPSLGVVTLGYWEEEKQGVEAKPFH